MHMCNVVLPNSYEQVVYGESAIIGDPYENRGTIYADHFSMVKFSSRSDSEYRKVLYAIEMLLEGSHKDESAQVTQSMFTTAMSTSDELKSLLLLGLSEGDRPPIPW